MNPKPFFENSTMPGAGPQIAAPGQAAYMADPRLKPYDNAQYLTLVAKLKMAKIPVDKLSFIASDLREMAADKTLRRGDVADIMEQRWPEIYAQTSGDIRDEVMSLSDKASNMNPRDPRYRELAAQIQRLAQLQSGIDEIESPKQIFFPDIFQFENNIRQALMQRARAARPSAGIPKKGAVVKGYRFKGGNPANKNNWEKI